MSAWLDALLGRIKDLGTVIPLGYGLNFTSGVRARLNTSTKFIDVDLRDASVSPAQLAAESSGSAAVFVMRIELTAGVTGTADDVAGDAAPCALRILDRWADVTANVGASTLIVRTEAGGAGDSLSGSISSAATGEGKRASSSSLSDESLLSAGAIPYVRRSDRAVAGTVYLLCARVS